MPFMELDEPTDNPCSLDHFLSNSESESSGQEFSWEELLNHEIWDEVLDNEVDEDNLEARNSPFVDADEQQNIPSSRMLLNCLVILLAFFLDYFPIPNNGMEFLLLSLKRFFSSSIIFHFQQLDCYLCLSFSWVILSMSEDRLDW